mmetsp:Transcript_25733/g.75954  ORF Transcript_25733/g.75954 Transcript_25733/m.75954 type:complete len:86 (+) Transcript_25733:318-575(+)
MRFCRGQSVEMNERKRKLRNRSYEEGDDVRSWETSKEEASKSRISNERVERVKKDRGYDCEGKKKRNGGMYGGGGQCQADNIVLR